MPNQRSKDKKSLTFWVSDDIKNRLEDYCREQDMSRTDAIQKSIELMLAELENQDHQKQKASRPKKRAKQQ